MISPIRFVVALLVTLALPAAASAEVSELWGAEGELWDPVGRLPDYSYAGYRAGREPIPDVRRVVDVRDFGARRDDSGDDSRAIQRAIDAAASRGGGAVYLPAGRYRIRDQLRIRRSGVVLRGAGRSRTTLYVTRSLGDIHGWDLSYANGNSGIISVGTGRGFSRVGTVARAARRGDRWIALNRDARAQGIRGGRFIRLTMEGARGDRSLWNHRHNDQNGSPGGACDDAYGELGYWIVRVRSVDGDRIELDQPLRQDVELRWNPVVSLVRPIREVGVEDLEIEMERRTYRGHHRERGYNGIGFGDGPVADSWIRNVRIRFADNGIDLRRSKHVTVSNVILTGDRVGTHDGHHGLTLGIDTLVEDLRIDADFIHELTFAERTTGSVVSRGDGAARWSLDHHSRAMIENLVTNLRASYDWESGGQACSPRAGARNTYWNFRDPLRAPSWGEIQTHLVGELGGGTSSTTSSNRRWYEEIRRLEPNNLYEAQLRRRLSVEDRGRFSSTELGGRRAFEERDPTRWAIARQGDDRRYWLASRAFSSREGGRLGEHALARAGDIADGAILGRANPFASLEEQPRANYALILGYQNERNYYFARFDARADKSGIYVVEGGTRRALATVPRALLSDSRWHDVGFARSGTSLTMTFDGAAVVSVDDATHGAGRVGIGSLDESVYFDDLSAVGGALTGRAVALDEEAPAWAPEDETVAESEGTWEEDTRDDDLEEGEEMLAELIAENMGYSDDDGVEDPDDAGPAGVEIRGGHVSCSASPTRGSRSLGWLGSLGLLGVALALRRRLGSGA